jgi:hypothetical protein
VSSAASCYAPPAQTRPALYIPWPFLREESCSAFNELLSRGSQPCTRILSSSGLPCRCPLRRRCQPHCDHAGCQDIGTVRPGSGASSGVTTVVSPRAAPATLMVRFQVEPAGTALCLSSTAIWVRTSLRPCAPAERPGHTAREGSTMIHPTHRDTVELQTRVNALSLEQKVRLLTGTDFWSLYPEPAAGLRRLVLSDVPPGVRGERWDERETSANVPTPTTLAASWDDGAMSAAGAAVRWLRNAIFSGVGSCPSEPDDYAWINAEAAKSVPGAGGVVFSSLSLGQASARVEFPCSRSMGGHVRGNRAPRPRPGCSRVSRLRHEADT